MHASHAPPDIADRQLPAVARRRRDWTGLIAAMSCLTAAAAIVTATTVVSFVRQERQRSMTAISIESLWRLRDEWNGEDMASIRSNAAAALLEAQPNSDVDDVLFFFNELAVLWNRGVLDADLIWYEFYWPMANYWAASRERVRALRRDDATRLAPLDALMERLVAIEQRQRQPPGTAAVPTTAQVRDFLSAEMEADACFDEDQDDARRMPL